MATLQYDFKVVGLNAVMAAFRTLEQRALQHNRSIDRMVGGTSRGPGRGALGAGGRVAGGVQQDAHVRERARVMRQRDAEDRREMTEAVRRNRRFLAFKDQMYREEARREDAHARRQIASQRQFERQRTRERDRAARAEYRERRRVVGGAVRSGVGAVSNVAGIVGSGLSLGAGMAIAAGISGEMKLGKDATLLAVMGKQAGEKGSIKDIQKGIVGRVREVGKETGLGRENLVAGMTSFFAKSGDVNMAKQMLPFFADIADVSGSSLEDIGKTAGMAYMQAINKGMTKEQAKGETEKILAAFAGQAAIGTVEMRDFAQYGPSLLSTAARFSGDYGRMAAVTGAMAQTGAFGGANSAAEAATSLARFADQIRDASDEFKALGVETYERNAQGVAVQRDPITILKDVLRKTEGGDERILAKFFSNVRSMRAVAGFNTMYREAGGGDAGMQAVERHLERFLNATLSEQQIKEGATAIRETPGRQFESAFNELKDSIGENLLPALTELAPAMGKLVKSMQPVIEAFGRLAEVAAKNPKTAAATVVGGFLGGEILGGVASAGVTALLTKFFMGGATTAATAGTTAAATAGTTAATAGTAAAGGLVLPALLAGGTAIGALLSGTLGSEIETAKLGPDASEGSKTFAKIRGFFGGIATATNPFSNPLMAYEMAQAGYDKSKFFGEQIKYILEGPEKKAPIEEALMFNATTGQPKFSVAGAAAPFNMEQDVAKMTTASAAQQKAADAFQQAVSAFQQAVASFNSNPGGGGGLLSGLFGLNRGDGPAPSNPSSGGR